jgi:hypothetical protein
MRAFLIALTVTLGVSAHGFAQSLSCTTPKPGDGWVCVGGGWLPPGHPDIPKTDVPTPDVPPPNQPTPDVPFKIGHRYTRNASGTPVTVYIMGAGQMENGLSVLFAECRTEGDGCYFKGMVRLFLSNATAKDWLDVTNNPYY